MNIEIKKERDGNEYAFDDSDVESQLSEIHIQKKKRKIVKKPSRVKHQSRKRSPSPPASVISEISEIQPIHKPLHDDTYEIFSNPTKIQEQKNETHEPSDEESPSVIDNESLIDSIYDQETGNDESLKPSPGFSSIKDEKSDLIYKFYRLSSKGIPISRKFNMNSDINEMRTEFAKIKRDGEVNSSIKFSRRMLMACVTGLEFMNKRYDPFDIHLDGWSESVMENVEDYDNVFERLHDKYNSKVQMPPEFELLLSLAGSAFMFHLTNTMFKSIPNIGDLAKQNPDIMKTMMETMSAAATQAQNTNSQPVVSQTTEQAQNESSQSEFREMKKPSFDISNMMPANMSSMFMPQQIIPDIIPPQPSAKPNQQKEKIKIINESDIEEDKNSVYSLGGNSPSVSISNSNVSEIKNVSITKKANKRKSKFNLNEQNTISI